MANKTSGYIVDVPVTLTVAVRGVKTEAEAIEAAEKFFAWHLARIADCNKGNGYIVLGAEITEFSLESPSDESSEILEELEAE